LKQPRLTLAQGPLAGLFGHGTLVALAIFIAVNAAIAVFTVQGAVLEHGSDVGTWYRPALGLLKYGGFVDPDDPSKYLTIRPPFYPMLIALLLRVTGTLWSLVVTQLALLFATGLVARAITERLLPGYGCLVMLLVVFNPSAIGVAHVLGSDTLYAFVFALLFWAVVEFAYRPAWRPALATGALLGASLLVRNPLEALLPLWPVVMTVLAVIAGGRNLWTRALLLGIAATVLAYAITVPWIAYKYRANEGFDLTSQEQKAWFLRKQVVYLEHCRSGLPNNLARDNRTEERKAHLAEIPGFERMTERQQANYVINDSIARMRTYSVRNYVCALTSGWALMYGSPGVSNLSLLFGEVSQGTIAYLRWNRFAEYFRKVPPATIVITVIGLAYVILVRLLNLFGAIAMVRRRAWVPLLTMFGAMTYLTLIMLFNGAARFRLPLDPLLFIIAAYGVAELRERWFKPASG